MTGFTDLPQGASWAIDYLCKEARELGEKAGKQAFSEDSLATYEADEMNDDPVRALAQDNWDFFYATVVSDAIEHLKPSRREGLPATEQVLEHVFETAFLPSVKAYLESVEEND
ncbi:MAG: hypothetical protein KJO07_00165 [Deltaproteobacteria bacterium]|nr:hypothetical protein [Deltaproteobacteria bacterium]